MFAASMTPILNHQDDIIRDSIIQNKERTKSYWEQLMMAASENQSNGKIKAWNKTDNSISNANGSRSFKQCNSSLNSHHCNNSNSNKEHVKNSNAETLKNCVRPDLSLNSLSMEDRIALELQEQKEREEELKQLRRQLCTGNGCRKEMPCFKETNSGNEELCSIHTNDDSNYSEYGSEEKEHSLDENYSQGNTPYSEDFAHRRTQSLDSVSSGLSSGSGSVLNDKDSPRRKILVRPYEDPQEEEEIPTYKRVEKETPIEQEIRIAKEREEELRKEKGIAISSGTKAEQKMLPRSISKRDAVENDPRDVQHRLATNRIQHEIEEANERENELRTEGKILTTSEETLDAKVTRFTQLAEYAISENRHKDSRMKRSLSVNHLLSADLENGPKKSVSPVKTSESRISRRYAPNPAQRGIMQRFIATKGRLSAPILTTNGQNLMQDKSSRYSLSDLSDYDSESFLQGGRGHPRKGYVPAGEKIQEELKEMERREEELRVQRAHNPVSSMTVRHRSQPNLLNLSYDEDGHEDPDEAERELLSWTSHKEHPKAPLRLSHSLSNPNLLDDGLEKVNIRLPNKRFSLLQQWENRIQGAQS